jgi:alkylation response protein AidB-like acyl-CoA dehydrogenase
MTTTLTLTADQSEIRAVARRFLGDRYPSERLRALSGDPDGIDSSTWDEIVDLGWVGIALGEAQGGAGYGTAERCLLLEEMGRVLAPVPYLSTAVLAADAVAAVKSEAGDALLRQFAVGTVRAALAAAGDLNAGADAAGLVRASGSGVAVTVSGPGGIVLDGGTATRLVVAAAEVDGTVGLFAVDSDAAGVERVPCPLVDETRAYATIAFEDAPAARLSDGSDARAAVDDALAASSVGLAAEMVGAAQRCVEMTLEYVKDRQQFGAPIGSFQAIKHRLADLSVLVDASRESVYLACDALTSGNRADAAACASSAKSAASDAYLRATAETIQLHGGIGFTWEHDAHLYYKRALVSARMLGGGDDHRERLARYLGV